MHQHKTQFECLLYTFVICIYISLKLFKDLNLRSLSTTNWCLSLRFKFNYFCLLAKKKKINYFCLRLKKKNHDFGRRIFLFLFFKVTQHTFPQKKEEVTEQLRVFEFKKKKKKKERPRSNWIQIENILIYVYHIYFFFGFSFPFVCGYSQTFHSNTNSF